MASASIDSSAEGAHAVRPAGTQGLVISALIILAMALLLNVGAIASIGSAVALAIFALVTVADLRRANETGTWVAVAVWRSISQRQLKAEDT
jgi:hypothetical protein